MKKNILIATTLALAGLPGLWANTAPTVVIHSAAMRPGTTLMDIVFRVNDPDDTTVKTRALAFKDGVRSFANVIKPTTFVEGTGSKIGDAIPANANHTITWDVAADWDVQLGQVKFEVLALDGRGLLPFEWITIPHSSITPEVTISKTTPTDAEVLNAFLWIYSSNDAELSLIQNNIVGTNSAGAFSGIPLFSNSLPLNHSRPYLFKKMGFSVANAEAISIASAARVSQSNGWLAMKNASEGIDVVYGIGNNNKGQINIPVGLNNVKMLAAGAEHSLALRDNQNLVGWGSNSYGQLNIPPNIGSVVSISTAGNHNLALRSDGTVVAWGANQFGQSTVPDGLKNVTSISAGYEHSLALKSDGTVVAWGRNFEGQATVSDGLSNVVAISAGLSHSLALKSDGTVITWGKFRDLSGGLWTPIDVFDPDDLDGVIKIASGFNHNLALKNDGTIVAWGGYGHFGETNIPENLNNITKIWASGETNFAMKNDGTIVSWGNDAYGQASFSENFRNVDMIAPSHLFTLFLIKDL